MLRINVGPWLFKQIIKSCKKTGTLYIYYFFTDSTAEIAEATVEWSKFEFVVNGKGFGRIYKHTAMWANLRKLLIDPEFYVPLFSNQIMPFLSNNTERNVLQQLINRPSELRRSELKSATYLLLKAMFGMKAQHREHRVDSSG